MNTKVNKEIVEMHDQFGNDYRQYPDNALLNLYELMIKAKSELIGIVKMYIMRRGI